MTTVETWARAILVVSALAALPFPAHPKAPQAPIAMASAAASAFDVYRATLVTTAVVGGTALAIIYSNGHMFPTYNILDGLGGGMMYGAYATGFREAVQLLGAISIAFYVDTRFRKSR
jgi:hypothetical protein